jgi:glc operon protein GlcG
MQQVTRRNFVVVAAAASAGTALAFAAQSEAQAPPYGSEINLEQAKRAIAAGEAEARKNGLAVAIAVVDNHGFLVAFEKLDGTSTGSVQVAIDKAVSAAIYRTPTKAFQDRLAVGGAGLRLLGLKGATPVEGGLPIVVGGRMIGAVGVSGSTADQDGQVAKAAVDGLA